MPPVPTQQLQEQIEELNAKLDKSLTQNASILDLLQGNPLNKSDGGILGEIQALHTKHDTLSGRVSKLEKFKDKIQYIGIGMGLVGGWGITDLLGKIFSKH